MSLVAGTRPSFQRIRVQIDRRLRIDCGYGATGAYCLGASRAPPAAQPIFATPFY
jgi:hypothetical protein